LAGSLLSESTLAQRDMELVLREAELNRREAALRRVGEARAEDEGSLARASSGLHEELEARLAEVERRERDLAAAVQAVESQRERLEAVRAEYESRREALAERTREVANERTRLRDEQAKLVCASLELEQREQQAPAPSEVVAHDALPQEPQNDAAWWSKQLGSPLEAA
jgi:peptidoglycan hydrolase CwlO-like protein